MNGKTTMQFTRWRVAASLAAVCVACSSPNRVFSERSQASGGAAGSATAGAAGDTGHPPSFGAAGAAGNGSGGGGNLAGAGGRPAVAAPVCGDGVPVLPEHCDDGNTDDNDGCSSRCHIETCGDGIQQATEPCDPAVQEGIPCTPDCKLCPTWYADADGDDRGDPASTILACAPSPPEGYVETADDCDDSDATLLFVDADNDAYGDVNAPVQACSAEPRMVADSSDCNDADDRVRPNQRLFFAAADSRGSFDYDCNGSEQSETTAVVGDCGSSGWGGDVPACGAEGIWVSLYLAPRSCSSNTTTRQQLCR